MQWLANVTWRIGIAQVLFGLLLGLVSFKYMTSCASLAPCQWAAVANPADGHYMDPHSDDGCAEADTDITFSNVRFSSPEPGLQGNMCAPQCEGGEDGPCPDGPKGTTSGCGLRYEGDWYCTIQCQPQGGLPDQCPAGTTCMPFSSGRGGWCLYPPEEPDPWPLETSCVEDVEIDPPGEWGLCGESARLALEEKLATATSTEDRNQLFRDVCTMSDLKACLQARCDQGLAEPGIKTTCDDVQTVVDTSRVRVSGSAEGFTLRELCEQVGVEPDVGCDTLANCPAFECPWQWSFVFCVPTALTIVSLVCVGCALMHTARELKLKKFYVVPVVDVPAQGSQHAAANTWATENPVAAANLQAAGAAVLHAHHPAQPAMEPMGGPPIQQPQAPQPPLSHPSAPAQAPMDGMAPASAPAQPGARGAFDVLNPF
eukprot:COSAG03_NODE_3430_length_2021_cov_13.434443_1_plen_428_part_00